MTNHEKTEIVLEGSEIARLGLEFWEKELTNPANLLRILATRKPNKDGLEEPFFTKEFIISTVIPQELVNPSEIGEPIWEDIVLAFKTPREAVRTTVEIRGKITHLHRGRSLKQACQTLQEKFPGWEWTSYGTPREYNQQLRAERILTSESFVASYSTGELAQIMKDFRTILSQPSED